MGSTDAQQNGIAPGSSEQQDSTAVSTTDNADDCGTQPGSTEQQDGLEATTSEQQNGLSDTEAHDEPSAIPQIQQPIQRLLVYLDHMPDQMATAR